MLSGFEFEKQKFMKDLQMLIDKWKQEVERLNHELNKDVSPTLLLELCTMRNRLQFCITDAELLLNAQKLNVSDSLPTPKEVWDAGVNEGMTRSRHHEWGMRRNDIEFDEWIREYIGSGSVSGQ